MTFLGIDLGTSNSVIAASIDSEIQVCPTHEGDDVLPSIIYATKQKRLIFGRRAHQQAVLSPGNVARGFKRQMGTNTIIQFEDAELELSPEECSAHLLDKLAAQAKLRLGDHIAQGAVICVPAAFDQLQAQATLRAAERAGLTNVKLLQEPIAAAMAAAEQGSLQEDSHFLVYDLGGGTLDLALIKSAAGSLSVEHHEGINMFGGSDFDSLIISEIVQPWLHQTFDLPENFLAQSEYRHLLGVIKLKSEDAKKELSTAQESFIVAETSEIRLNDRSGAEIYLDVPISLGRFKSLVEPMLQRSIGLCEKLIDKSLVRVTDIKQIVFIGGPTRMRWIREFVAKEIGLSTRLDIDPMTSVAIGAAIFGETLAASEPLASELRPSIEELDIRFGYPTVTSDTSTAFRVRVGEKSVNRQYKIEVLGEEDWSSEEFLSEATVRLELPLPNRGANSFIVRVRDLNTDEIVHEAHISILRRASISTITASRTISVKVRDERNASKSRLEVLVKKGMPLPAMGSRTFKAAESIEAGSLNKINVQIYQDEGAAEPDLNLFVGNLAISGESLPAGSALQVDDDIVVDWSINESGILEAVVSVPAIGQSFRIDNAYVPGDGEIDANEAKKWAGQMLLSVRDDLQSLLSVSGDSVASEISVIRHELDQHAKRLENAFEADTARLVTDELRRLRRSISVLKHRDDVRRAFVKSSYQNIVLDFDRLVAIATENRGLTERIRGKFDHVSQRLEELCADPNAELESMELMLNELKMLMSQLAFSTPRVLEQIFNSIVGQRYLSIDKVRFDSLKEAADCALKDQDFQALARHISDLAQTLMGTGGIEEMTSNLLSGQ